ncbi:hypothetical protein EVG20_g7743 [Dentipellis fragilis]|uniref:Uncharacterized protein n=1 Tax=Dentipellis fragilis TaxID=205917 RepID=A0A4Y9YB67_9AGAM|nr:hypothetical protein EVG20_g7743 [Dentipellis fragilis]
MAESQYHAFKDCVARRIIADSALSSPSEDASELDDFSSYLAQKFWLVKYVLILNRFKFSIALGGTVASNMPSRRVLCGVRTALFCFSVRSLVFKYAVHPAHRVGDARNCPVHSVDANERTRSSSAILDFLRASVSVRSSSGLALPLRITPLSLVHIDLEGKEVPPPPPTSPDQSRMHEDCLWHLLNLSTLPWGLPLGLDRVSSGAFLTHAFATLETSSPSGSSICGMRMMLNDSASCLLDSFKPTSRKVQRTSQIANLVPIMNAEVVAPVDL